MRAVNLIPEDERRGAGGVAGRSGGAAYLVLGGLAALLLLVAAYTLSGRTLNDRKAELARVESDAQAAEARASSLQAYTSFASLRARRVDTVRSIASSRFDWSFAMHEVARVIPDDVWLTALTGTVSPDVNVGSGGDTSSLRGDMPNPAIEITGCTTSQDEVARMMTRMRLVDGVARVALQESSKADDSGGGGGGGGGDDCRNGSDRFPKFSMVVFFKPVEQAVAAPASPSAATGTASPTSATTTTPTTTTGATP